MKLFHISFSLSSSSINSLSLNLEKQKLIKSLQLVKQLYILFFNSFILLLDNWILLSLVLLKLFVIWAIFVLFGPNSLILLLSKYLWPVKLVALHFILMDPKEFLLLGSKSLLLLLVKDWKLLFCEI